MPEKEVPFPEVPKSWTLTAFFTVTLLVTLYFMSEGGGSAVDPIFMYLILGTLLVVLGVSTPGFKNIRRVLGFTEPPEVPGANIFMAIMGVGLAMLVMGIITKPLMVLFAGNAQALAIVRPLYLPLSIEPYMFTLPAAITDTMFGIILFFLVVGFGEQVFHIITWKNLTNAIEASRFRDRIPTEVSVFIGFIISGIIFSSWHLLSWGPEMALGFFGILSATYYLFIFYLTYLIPDVIGIFTPEKTIAWKQIFLMGSVTAHTAWNVLITTEIPLTGLEIIGIGFGLVILSLVGMWLSRWIHTKKYYVAPF